MLEYCDRYAKRIYMEYGELELYWIGQMYAYMHCLSRLSSKEIYERLPLNEMRHFYITGHEMSMYAAFEKIKEAL
jgi:hypothetical protein